MTFKTLTSVLLLSYAFTSPAQAKVNLDFSNEYNPQSIHAQGDMFFIIKLKN